jgi:hypothetical protein
MSLEDEFHKSLLDESKVYREKVSTIWLQEFTILGAIIAFAATKVEASSKKFRISGRITSRIDALTAHVRPQAKKLPTR